MLNVAYAVVCWRIARLVCRIPNRAAKGLMLLARLDTTRTVLAPVVGVKVLLEADRPSRLGVPLTIVGCFFGASIDLVFGATAVETKVEFAAALSFS